MSKKLIIYTDGGSRGNPGESACAFVVFNDQEIIHQQGIYLGKKTNNEAEYLGVLSSLKWLKTHQKKTDFDQVTWLCDSLLIVEQISGRWQIKNPNMRILRAECFQLLIELFPTLNYEFKHIEREKNTLVDALVNKILDDRKSK